MPQWARAAFPSYMTHLNRIQSTLYKQAFTTPDNLLVCAPTGAGKTNIAMLACLQTLDEMRTERGFNLKKFKIIYIAPMKALVSEVVGSF
jgi:pre-mRNA-splicing helicase BRR2